MIGLNPGPLVRVLFHCVLMIPLVVYWVGVWHFLPTGVESIFEVSVFVLFVPIGVESKVGQLIEKKLAIKVLISPSNFKISFIVIVMV